MSSEHDLRANEGDIRRFYKLMNPQNRVVELRVLEAGQYDGTISGYFDDENKFTDEVLFLTGEKVAKSVYMTINPVIDDLAARSYNVAKSKSKSTTKDDEIAQRARILIDIDARTPAAQISATDKEHDSALEKGREVDAYLSSKGFPQPLYVDSGNGCYLIYACDMPNNAESLAMITALLNALDKRFTDDSAKIDVTPINASRICKIAGTIARKGSHTPAIGTSDARPWRVSRIISSPDELSPVDPQLIQSVIDDLQPVNSISIDGETCPIVGATMTTTTKKVPAGFDASKLPSHRSIEIVEKLLTDHGFRFREPSVYETSLKWQLEECRFADDHSTGLGGACVYLTQDGTLIYSCSHDSCKRNNRNAIDVFGKNINGVDLDDVELYEVEPQKPKKKKKSGKDIFAKIVDLWQAVNKDKYPKAIDQKMHLWDGKKYVADEDFSGTIRIFAREKGFPRSNNIIGNAVPNILADCRVKVEKMPFWDGDNCPCDLSNLIAFRNGLFDQSSGQLYKHTPQFVSRNCLDFDFDPFKTCPNWLRFLSQIFPDGEDRAMMLQEFFGYCLTQDTSLQKALLLIGKPRSGKGTIQRILSELVGRSNTTAFNLDALTKDFGLSPLVGKQLAIVGEVELSNHPQRTKITEVVKSIIGEDPQMINTKFSATMPTVKLGARFVIAANTIPRLYDSSGALTSRLLFLPFLESFLGREDHTLQERLISELPGICNWALEGLARLRRNAGKFTLGPYHNGCYQEHRDASSPLLGWLTDCVNVEKWASSGDLPATIIVDTVGITASKKELFASYESWCIEKGLEAKTINWFCHDLKIMLPKLAEMKVRENGSRVNVYRGLAIRQTEA